MHVFKPLISNQYISKGKVCIGKIPGANIKNRKPNFPFDRMLYAIFLHSCVVYLTIISFGLNVLQF